MGIKSLASKGGRICEGSALETEIQVSFEEPTAHAVFDSPVCAHRTAMPSCMMQRLTEALDAHQLAHALG